MSEPPISSSETDEQLDLEGWRKKLEDERIEKYLSDLNKHVHHVRIPVGAKTIGVRQRPTPRQFKFVQPSTQTAASLESDQPDDNVEQVDGEITNGAQLHSLTGKWSVMEVDWLKFGIAYLQYLLNPSITALTPFEPFSIPRLRSNTTRLYTAARPGLERFGSIVARVCLWESRLITSIVVVIYSILVMTGTLLPALLLLPLYPLLSYRFFPPSPQILHQEAAEATRRSQQVDEIVDEIAEDNDLDAKVEDSPSSEQGRPSRRAGQGIGIGIDLSKVHGIRDEVEELTGAELSGAQKKGSKGKSKKTRLRAWKKHVEEEYGAGIVVVVGDLADCAEKLKNLYFWCSPSVSTTFAVGLVCTSALTYFAPLWLLVKLFQIAIGVVAFVVVPIIAAQEQYEPMSWLFGTAPTDAEYAIELLRQRAAAGVPLIIPRKSSSLDTRSINSDVSSYASSVRTPPPLPPRDRFKQGLQKVGNQGLNLLDTSRQIASGEREVKFSFRPSDTASIATTSSGSSSQRFNIGKKGPGITIAPKAGLEDATVSTFFAQHKRGPGILTISPEAISFKALLPQKEKVVLDTPDGPVPTETKWKGVEIPFRDVVGVKRTDKTSFFVVLASGLQIESKDGIIVSFPIVSNRDQAFQLLLSFVDRQLAKV